MLARFTQIDYDREMTLVALAKAGQKERILGVVQIISAVRQNQAEFAVAVGDLWQGNPSTPYESCALSRLSSQSRVNTCVSFPIIQIANQPIRSSFLPTVLYNL
jgi:hypothetical protein